VTDRKGVECSYAYVWTTIP